MSKRLTITLTDEEYGDLERLALQERRTERDMAAYLIMKHSKPAPAMSQSEVARRLMNQQQQQIGANVPSFGTFN